MYQYLRTGSYIIAGVLVTFIFFITTDNLSANLGLNSPLFAVFIPTVFVSMMAKRKIVDAVFPLIGIGFYLLISWMIIRTDMLYGSYTEEYGIVLLGISIVAFVLWVIYFIIIQIIRELFNHARQRIGELFANVFQILTIFYALFKLYQIKRNLLFGLTGVAAISAHILLHINNVEYLLLDLSSFAIASSLALIPFYTRTTHKKSQRTKEMVDIQSSVHSLKQKLPKPKLPKPWKAISIPSFSVDQINPVHRLSSFRFPSIKYLRMIFDKIIYLPKKAYNLCSRNIISAISRLKK